MDEQETIVAGDLVATIQDEPRRRRLTPRSPALAATVSSAHAIAIAVVRSRLAVSSFCLGGRHSTYIQILLKPLSALCPTMVALI